MPTLPSSVFGFCGPCYQAITPLLDAQDCLNYYPEPALASSKEQMGLIGTPGLTLFGTLPRSPVRALFAGNGRLFAVGGTHFYEVNTSGGVLTDYGAIPGSSGTLPCKIVANGNDVTIVDASAADTATTSGGGLVSGITAFDIDYLDTFYLVCNSSVLNQVNQSASLDGTTWPSLAFAVREGTSDFLTALAIINNLLYLLGQKNMEVWYNAGLSPFAFQRGSGAATVNAGCSNRYSVSKVANTIAWLGSDDRGFYQVLSASGQTPVRLSNYAIENLISGYNVASEVQISPGNVRCFAYKEDGHEFYVMNFNGANGGLGATLVYDFTTGLWHRRAYLNPGTGALERIRADCFASVPAFGPGAPITGQRTTLNLVGDYQNGNIYVQSLSTPGDNGAPIRRIRTAPHICNRDLWTSYPSLRIDGTVGSATCLLELSDDGGNSFRTTGAGVAIGTTTPSGPGSQMPYYLWNQLGRSRDRVFRTTITSSSQLIRLVGAYLKANPGTEI